jgi:uncharacterized repeat protein (TIGR01451 family)
LCSIARAAAESSDLCAARGASFAPVIHKVGLLAPGTLGLPGDQITWVITVANAGPVPETNLVITDVLRDELRIDAVVSGRGAFTADGQAVIFKIPVLNPGDTVELRIATTVSRGLDSSAVVNEATLLANGPDGPAWQSATAQIALPTSLPATGYAGDLPGDGEPSVMLVGVMSAAVVALTAWIVWRRGSARHLAGLMRVRRDRDV